LSYLNNLVVIIVRTVVLQMWAWVGQWWFRWWSQQKLVFSWCTGRFI